MNTDVEQILTVLAISYVVYLLLSLYPSMALQVVTAFVSFFVSVLVYEQFLKGSKGAVSILGNGEIARVAVVFAFFWGAVLGSTYISSVLPQLLLGYIPGTNLNSLQTFGLSLLFTVLTFIGMRLMYYSHKPWNYASIALIVIVVVFFVLMFSSGWSLSG